jgi:hypothetical protein
LWWEFHRFDDVVRRLRRWVDIFRRVHVFCLSCLKERDCSLRLDLGEQSGSERKATSRLSALAGSGAKSNAVPRIISWREIAAEQPEARKTGG